MHCFQTPFVPVGKNAKKGMVIAMETVLYADVLFLIDFSMDFISLYITGKLLHAPMHPLRFAIAAAIGAITSVVSTAYLLPPAAEIMLSIISSAAMAVAAFGRGSIWIILRRIALLWTSGVLLGGMVTAVMSLGSGGEIVGGHSGGGSTALIFLGVALVLVAVEIIGRVSKKKSARVKVTIFNSSAEFSALADSGNLLVDPFSGTPVIIVSSAALTPILTVSERQALTKGTPDGAGNRLVPRVRLIPSSSVGGEKMLCAFRPDAVQIDGKNVTALVAPDEKERGGFGEYDCIVPSSLV